MASGPSETLHRALISLGSNVDPERHMPLAIAILRRRVHLLRVSSAWETPPVGPPGQPAFLNAAALLETRLGPAAIRSQVLRPIEAELGRQRPADPYAPRPIDLDLVLYNDHVSLDAGAPLPDPDLLRHLHLALPVAEIAPEIRHPVTGETLAEIRRRLLQDDPSACRRVRRRPDVSLDASP
jgi:2-amino-4-hydroxy-6-hydroxymethyldihydropteridine diphosphokinase